MKKILLFLLTIGTSSIASAQLQVNTLNITTNDLVYDSQTNRIYVSIPSANGSNGNSIGVINPDTYTLENTIFIGSEPSVLAISDNGQYIYSGFSGSSTIRRFDVARQTADLQFSLGNRNNNTGAFYAEDIEVMPGQPTTIAVSRRNYGFSPRHEGVAIYDNGIMRPTTTEYHTGSNKIEFTNQNSLIGYNNETTEFGIRRLSVNNSGISNVNVTQNILTNFDVDFIYKNNHMYSTNGKVIDITTTPYVIGSFSNTNGPVAYDEYFNRVCFASYDYSGNITFKRFNPNTFLLYDSLPISQAYGTAIKMTTCGNGCYAFNTTDDKVVIIKDRNLGIADLEDKNNISVYPNPTTDYLYVKNDINIKTVQISDINGKIINNIKPLNNKIDLTSLSKGVYMIKLIDNKGEIFTKKVIKK